jgi:hypothetical protein
MRSAQIQPSGSRAGVVAAGVVPVGQARLAGIRVRKGWGSTIKRVHGMEWLRFLWQRQLVGRVVGMRWCFRSCLRCRRVRGGRDMCCIG